MRDISKLLIDGKLPGEELRGRIVVNKKYGSGVVVDYVDTAGKKFILVQFRKGDDEVTFPYPASFKGDDPHLVLDTTAEPVPVPDAGPENVNQLEQYDPEILEALTKLDKYKITEQSKRELAGYFMYLSRGLSTGKKIHYNFYLHSEDDALSAKFVSDLVEVAREFDSSLKKPRFLPESRIVKPSDIDDLWGASFVVVYRCYSYNQYNNKTDEKNEYDAQWRGFLRFCEQTPEICKILCASKEVTRDRFRNNEHLYFRVMSHHIYFSDFTEEDVLAYVTDELVRRGFILRKQFRTDLQEYVRCIYSKADLKSATFCDDLLNRILGTYYASPKSNKVIGAECVPFYKKEQGQNNDLNSLVGLSEVKKSIRELESYMRFYKKSRENGLVLDKLNLNMLFTGNPGTGKTTVAKMLAGILYDIGIISRNKLIVAQRQDLCAEYLGQTAVKTANVIREAAGGVLFIDEAYSLTQGRNGADQYGLEAISVMLPAMERGDTVFIFAGYEDEMENFVDTNPGIRSRIGYRFSFPDYSTEEMLEIYVNAMKRQGFDCPDSSNKLVKALIEKYGHAKESGNGRFIARLMQGIIIRHAGRINELSNATAEQFREITAEDILTDEEAANLFAGEQSQQWGFIYNR